MRRLLACCAASILIYIAVFGWLADRPLSAGLLHMELDEKAARLATLPSPKLVILAGSNGPFSHSCAVIGAMLNLPCENAGIAVGIGLDYVFARYRALIRPGDIVYMPMELEQYVTTRAMNRSGVDGAILLRDDRSVLLTLPPDRIAGAIFCCNLEDLLDAAAEMPLVRFGHMSPQVMLAGEYSGQGDRIDTPLAQADPSLLASANRQPPDAAAIAGGYGTTLISAFIANATSRGVIVIGGLPTDFDTVALPPATLQTIQSVFAGHHAKFLVLPNLSRYPVADFFNSEDHLAQPCQYLHSILVAQGIAKMIGHPVAPPRASVTAMAATCPSYQAISAALWPAIRAQASASSSSNNSVSLRIIVPPSSSASTMVTARR